MDRGDERQLWRCYQIPSGLCSLLGDRCRNSSGLPFGLILQWKWKWSHSVVSDSLQPHGLQPTRLLCPWDFPDKNTGVGFHFLLQMILLTQGSNPGLSHCRQMLYHLSHQGSLILQYSMSNFSPLLLSLPIYSSSTIRLRAKASTHKCIISPPESLSDKTGNRKAGEQIPLHHLFPLADLYFPSFIHIVIRCCFYTKLLLYNNHTNFDSLTDTSQSYLANVNFR